jgi:hypothetical protein
MADYTAVAVYSHTADTAVAVAVVADYTDHTDLYNHYYSDY